MKALISAAALAALPLTPAMAMQDELDPNAEAFEEEVLGVFAGSYTCQDGEHGIFLELVVTSQTDTSADISGTLGFVPTVSGKSGRSGMVAGSFEVSGTLMREGMKLTLEPGDWVVQPENYGAARLEGVLSRLDNDLLQIVGKPVVPGMPGFCSDLIATEILFAEEEAAE